MTNKLIIIGNGFDLAHGLKTRYSDFLFWYLTKIVKTIIGQKEYSDALFTITMQGVYYSSPGLKIDIEKIEDFDTFINNQIHKIQFRATPFAKSLLRLQRIYNWVDIENMYYETLLLITHDKKRGVHNHEIQNEVSRLNACMETIKIELTKYLLTLKVPEKIDEIQTHFDDIKFTRPNNICVLNFNWRN